LVMVRAAATMRLNALLTATEVLSVTWTVKLAGPELVGVPLMTPVAGFMVRPPGSKPAVMVQAYAGVPPTACKLIE